MQASSHLLWKSVAASSDEFDAVLEGLRLQTSQLLILALDEVPRPLVI
jgi:hypothetical protein